MKREKMKSFIVSRGTLRVQHEAESLEELNLKLDRHAEAYPKARPVSKIEEGRLFTWEEEQELKRDKLRLDEIDGMEESE
jgi:hypothetical protein